MLFGSCFRTLNVYALRIVNTDKIFRSINYLIIISIEEQRQQDRRQKQAGTRGDHYP